MLKKTKNPKITKRLVESTKPAKNYFLIWDREVRGFGLRVNPSAVKSYVVQYRNAHGDSRRLTIGNHGRLTAENARIEAKRLLGLVSLGRDPIEEKRQARKGETIADLCREYLSGHAEPHKKTSSLRHDHSMIERLIKPALGNRKIKDITTGDVHRLHGSLRGTPYQANRVVALLSKMFNCAEAWGMTPGGSNPCRHLKRYKEGKRERYLSAEELACLGETLTLAGRENVQRSSALNAIRLLIFTGCRLSEVLTLRWDYVDFDHACLRLPDSKTGAKEIQLNAPALQVLADMERDRSGWVIVGQKPKRHLVNLEKPWRHIRNRATVRLWAGHQDPAVSEFVSRLRERLGREPTYEECQSAAYLERQRDSEFALPKGLTDVRLHDLRHSFASVAAGLGEGLPMIGKLLGHTNVATTARYAHLADNPQKVATERIGAALAGMMAGNSAQVVELTARRK